MATTIRRNLVSKFKHLLKEGLVYTVKNFKVVVNSGAYRVVNSKFKIMFTLLTTVKRVEDIEPSIPMHGFQYINEKMVNTRVNDDSILTGTIFLSFLLLPNILCDVPYFISLLATPGCSNIKCMCRYCWVYSRNWWSRNRWWELYKKGSWNYYGLVSLFDIYIYISFLPKL